MVNHAVFLAIHAFLVQPMEVLENAGGKISQKLEN